MYLCAVAPTILVSPSPLDVTRVEEAISLSCNASGFPVPTVSWSHNGTDVTANTRLSIETQYGDRSVLSTLGIAAMNVTVNDSGEYVCTASSSFGDAVHDSALVLVQGVYIYHTYVCMYVCMYVSSHEHLAPLLEH